MVGENYVVIQQENFRLINLEYLYETAKPRYQAFTSATDTNATRVYYSDCSYIVIYYKFKTNK